jgi:hypothetical protein
LAGHPCRCCCKMKGSMATCAPLARPARCVHLIRCMPQCRTCLSRPCFLLMPTCKPQEQAVRLQMIYTVATSAFCFCVWPAGLVLDSYGPRACCMMGAAFFGAGCGLFAVSDATLDLFMPGFVLMAIGGLPIVLSMMHLSGTCCTVPMLRPAQTCPLLRSLARTAQPLTRRPTRIMSRLHVLPCLARPHADTDPILAAWGRQS